MNSGANGHVEKRDQRARNQKAAQPLQVAQRLVFPPRPVQRGMGGRAEDRRAELHGDLDGGAHQDEAAQRVENGLKHDRPPDHEGKHHQRVDRAAGQHPIGNLEQVDRDRQHEDVGGAGQEHHEAQVAADRGHSLPQVLAKVFRADALVKARAFPASTTTAATGGWGRPPWNRLSRLRLDRHAKGRFARSLAQQGIGRLLRFVGRIGRPRRDRSGGRLCGRSIRRRPSHRVVKAQSAKPTRPGPQRDEHAGVAALAVPARRRRRRTVAGRVTKVTVIVQNYASSTRDENQESKVCIGSDPPG